ncbi:MAG TPA: hypothetical protein DEF79_12665 [Gammaproteobacteria bacterium]|nr:hypothetical protein [Gammaproteobacteria bacterium]
MKFIFTQKTPDTMSPLRKMLLPKSSPGLGLNYLIASALLLLSGTSLAAQTQSPITWSADGELIVTIEKNRRVLKISDNVKISQDDINISGNSAIFEYTLDTQELLRVTVLGTPARYTQGMGNSVEKVTGNSDTLILYDDEVTEDTIVEMIDNASIKSPSSTMNCTSIVYITEQDLIREAVGPCQGALSPQNGV